MVDSSSLSLTTFLFSDVQNMRNLYVHTSLIALVGVSLSGCAKDPCTQMCKEVAKRMGECLQEWPVSWEVFGASSQEDFSTSCQTTWAVERSILEPRALDDAYEQCNDARTYLSTDEEICDHFRALYLIDENYE